MSISLSSRLKKMNKTKQAIKYTLQCLISIYIALEIATPPNPYKMQIIVLLSLLIALKHDIPDKIVHLIEKLIVKWLNRNWR